MIALLPLYLLLQVMPPPFGTIVANFTLGIGGSRTDYIVSLPVPPPAPAEDCHCGVPASPRGPR